MRPVGLVCTRDLLRNDTDAFFYLDSAVYLKAAPVEEQQSITDAANHQGFCLVLVTPPLVTSPHSSLTSL